MAFCIVTGCPGGRFLHQFPRNLAMIKLWLHQTQQDFGDLDVYAQRVLTAPAGLFLMCSRHFSPECYVTDGSRSFLKADAVPTIFTHPTPSMPVMKVVNVKQENVPVSVTPPSVGRGVGLSATSIPRLPPPVRDASASSCERGEEMQTDSMLKCFVTDCPNSAEDQPLIPGVTLHTFPTDLARVKLWLHRSGQHFKNLDVYAKHVLRNWDSFRICSSHFTPDSYLAHSAGTILTPGVLPSIFPMSDFTVVKVEEDDGFGVAGEGIDVHMDEMRGVRHVGTAFDPTWGIRSVGILTRPILVKDAATATITTAVSNNRPLKLLTPVADKGVQCCPLDFIANNRWQARTDYFYQAGPFMPPGGMDISDSWLGLSGGLKGTSQEDSGPNEGVPVRDSRLFLALEEVLISLMQHLVSAPLIEENAKFTTHRILQQALQIIGMVTGDKWVIGERQEDLESLDEVPVKCGDVGVYFTPDEWDYVESHRKMYMDIIPEDPLLNLIQQEMASDSESEDDDKSNGKNKNSPEWKPHSDGSGPSGSEVSSEESAADSDNYEHPREAEFWKNPDLRIDTAEDGKKIFFCLKCEVPVKDRQTFISHLKSLKHINFRAENEEVTCENCGEVLPTRSALIKHRAENHATKRYACTICGLEYEYISQWIIHQRAHTGERPYECDKCGKTFGHKSSLLVHRQRHITGKTIKCRQCDQMFDTKIEMWRHEKEHRPKKPFECSVCGKGFGSRWNFRRHMSEHGVTDIQWPEKVPEATMDLEMVEEGGKGDTETVENAGSDLGKAKETRSDFERIKEARNDLERVEEASGDRKRAKGPRGGRKRAKEASDGQESVKKGRRGRKRVKEARSDPESVEEGSDWDEEVRSDQEIIEETRGDSKRDKQARGGQKKAKGPRGAQKSIKGANGGRGRGKKVRGDQEIVKNFRGARKRLKEVSSNWEWDEEAGSDQEIIEETRSDSERLKDDQERVGKGSADQKRAKRPRGGRKKVKEVSSGSEWDEEAGSDQESIEETGSDSEGDKEARGDPKKVKAARGGQESVKKVGGAQKRVTEVSSDSEWDEEAISDQESIEETISDSEEDKEVRGDHKKVKAARGRGQGRGRGRVKEAMQDPGSVKEVSIDQERDEEAISDQETRSDSEAHKETRGDHKKVKAARGRGRGRVKGARGRGRGRVKEARGRGRGRVKEAMHDPESVKELINDQEWLEEGRS